MEGNSFVALKDKLLLAEREKGALRERLSELEGAAGRGAFGAPEAGACLPNVFLNFFFLNLFKKIKNVCF